MHRTKPTQLQRHLQQLRQQHAQTGQDALGEVLAAPELEHIFLEETGRHRQRLYPPLVTLRLFIDQILCGEQACQAAVSQRLAARVMQGHAQCSLSTGSYCKARKRLSLKLLERLCRHVGAQMQSRADAHCNWQGRAIKLFDATTVSMPDTFPNQQAWPQSARQAPGLGFPVARIGALISLSSGGVIDYAIAPMQGKDSGEQTLLRQLFGSFSERDILLADALHSTWWALHMLSQRGVDVVMPHDGRRKLDFAQGKIHSRTDHLAWWPRPKRAAWMSKEQYAQMPQGMWVREVQVGGRVLMTTLLDPCQASACEIDTLYAMRWNIEVDFRTLKTDMRMEVLRCKSPAMVEKEIAVYLLTYNLVRWVMVQAAQVAGKPARDMSFTSARRLILAFAGYQRQSAEQEQSTLARVLLQSIASCLLPKRPGRIEPRAKKRRPKPLALLLVPRCVAREQIRARRA
jgi:hypothetical protein